MRVHMLIQQSGQIEIFEIQILIDKKRKGNNARG